LDEIRIFSNLTRDTTAPKTPESVAAAGTTVTIKITWQANTEPDLAGYRIYRESEGVYKAIGSAVKSSASYTDYTGIPPKTYKYKVSAYDLSGNESGMSSEAIGSTTSLSDSALMDMVQRETFKFFWDYAHPVSGLIRDRTGGGDVVTSGGSGFGVMALLVGIERGFITRAQGVVRMLQILNFLSLNADRFHGAFPHWLNGVNGRVIPFSTKDNGGDLVETAFLVQGLLAARQYFNKQNTDEDKIRQLITYIWESVEWDWYRKDASGNYLYWHWSPNYNWEMNMPIKGWNEAMIVYLLAVASPTHGVPASLYHKGWAGGSNYKNGKSYFGIPLPLGPDYGGPLFFAHYSFLGFDPRNKKDAYANYFVQNRNHSLIHQAWSKENPRNFTGYDADTWGLTASDDPLVGYLAHEPNNDNGTIAPTAALSSMPYTPKESMDALRSFYYEYGLNLWGEYGFKDAFNLQQGWYANSYLAIDQGPIIVMIENYRTGLLWKYFMANSEIKPMMDAIGFVPDTLTSVDETIKNISVSFKLHGNFPNPFNPATTIEYSLPSEQQVEIEIFDILGRNIRHLFTGKISAGVHNIKWDGRDNNALPAGSGVYLYVIRSGSQLLSGKMLLQK
ncbi:MAG: glucoamylase family protein, partial [Syntrophothermus sp.]